MKRKMELYKDILIQVTEQQLDGISDFDAAVDIMNKDYDLYPTLSELVVLKLEYRKEYEPNGQK